MNYEREIALCSSPQTGCWDGILIHYTGGGSGRDTARWIATDPDCKVSWHYLICRDGRIIEQLDLDRIGWHAGKSLWPHSDGTKKRGANKYSIGIEIANRGEGEPYRAKQYEALADLIDDLESRGVPRRLFGHNEVSPGRKIDPGPHFDWSLFR